MEKRIKTAASDPVRNATKFDSNAVFSFGN
jgi:hypothetical protein